MPSSTRRSASNATPAPTTWTATSATRSVASRPSEAARFAGIACAATAAHSLPSRTPSPSAVDRVLRKAASVTVVMFSVMRGLRTAISFEALLVTLSVVSFVSLLTACGSDVGTGASPTSSGGQSGASTSAASGAASIGQSGAGATAIAGAAGGQGAGEPVGSCSKGVPLSGQPADTSKPTSVVGSGTAASCSFAALKEAVTQGGVITFDCGPAPVTLSVTSTLNLPTNKNTVIDGGNKITLDGGQAVQILRFD